MLSVRAVRLALGRELLKERPGGTSQFSGVCNDSRKAKAGDLFVALQTENRDGHDFILEAIVRGASGVLVMKDDVPAPEGVSVFRVRDTQHALGELASWWRDRFDVRTIVVTGNVGKTTTKELTAAVLGSQYSVLKSPANFNDEIGLSMTLFELRSDHQRAVLETGMFARGEIRRMCEIAKPSIGVVLNVGPTHLERLGSMEAIAEAKVEAIEALPEWGTAVLNADDPYVAKMRVRTKARVLTFGMAPEADVRASEVQGRGLAGVDFMLRCGPVALAAHTPVPGVGLVHDALAAVAVAIADGMSVQEAVAALRAAEAPTRLRVRRARSGATILDDSYNAGPASMLAALEVLSETTGRRLALLGDMLELGGEEAAGHRRVGERAAEVVDALYTVGERGEMIARAAREAGLSEVTHFGTKEEASRALAEALGPGDILLVKASHGLALDRVVEELAE